MTHSWKYLLVIALAVVSTLPSRALSDAELDSVLTSLDSVRLDDVTVLGTRRYMEVIPSQTLTGARIEQLNSHSVADAIRYFSGIQLKDYGGVGGVKTVDLRSMGSHHMGVFYDGIQLGNAQNGQIDLGQFSLDNVDEISLYNGQKSAIFQAATDFASASSVYIRTRRPHFAPGKKQNWRAKAKYGASDLLRLSALYEQQLADSLSLGINASTILSRTCFSISSGCTGSAGAIELRNSYTAW